MVREPVDSDQSGNVAIYLGKSLSLVSFCGWLAALVFVAVRRGDP